MRTAGHRDWLSMGVRGSFHLKNPREPVATLIGRAIRFARTGRSTRVLATSLDGRQVYAAKEK